MKMKVQTLQLTVANVLYVLQIIPFVQPYQVHEYRPSAYVQLIVWSL